MFLDTEKQENNSAPQPPLDNSTAPDDNKTTDTIPSQNIKDDSATPYGVGVPTTAENPKEEPTEVGGTAAASTSGPTRIGNFSTVTPEQEPVTSTVSDAHSSGKKPAKTVRVIGSDENTSPPTLSADHGVAPSIMPPAMSANDYGSYKLDLILQIESSEVAPTVGAWAAANAVQSSTTSPAQPEQSAETGPKTSEVQYGRAD